MKILFIHRNLPSTSQTGVAIQVDRLAKALSRSNIDVTVACLHEKCADSKNYSIINLIGDPETSLLSKFILSGPWKRILIPWIFSRMNTYSYDIVHIHGDGGFVKYTPKMVRTFYGTAKLEMKFTSDLKGKVAQFLSYYFERKEAKSCSMNVAIASHIKSFIKPIHTVIPCIAHIPDYKHLIDKTQHPSIIFLGSLSSRKNGELMIELHLNLRKIFNQLVLHFIGPARDREKIEPLQYQGIYFHSGIGETQLMSLYNQSWLFVSLADYEGFGVGIIEAMTCGCPVLSVTHSGALEIITHGENGILSERSELKKKIELLLQSPPLRKRLIKNGLAHSKKYSPSVISGNYLDLYSKILTETNNQ